MASLNRKLTITIQLWSNTLRSKDNHTTQFDQLTEYNMKDVFLQNSYAKRGRQTSPKIFPRNKNRTYLWISSLKLYAVCFIRYPIQGLPNILKIKCWSFAFSSCEAFSENKMRSGTSLPASFLAWFFNKIVSLVIFFNWSNFVVWFPLLLEIMGNMKIVIIQKKSWILKLT